MIRIIQICSAAAVLVAVLVLAMPFFAGDMGFENADKILSTPTAIESFQKSNKNARNIKDEKGSPMTKQAEKFALFLDPPEPKRTTKPPQNRPSRNTTPSRPAPKNVSASFRLLGTSYLEGNQEKSFALIDKPGEGMRWVKKGDSIGHLVVEEIKAGVLKLNDGQNVRDMQVEKQETTNLVRNYYPPGKEVPKELYERKTFELGGLKETGNNTPQNQQNSRNLRISTPDRRIPTTGNRGQSQDRRERGRPVPTTPQNNPSNNMTDDERKADVLNAIKKQLGEMNKSGDNNDKFGGLIDKLESKDSKGNSDPSSSKSTDKESSDDSNKSQRRVRRSVR